MKLIEKTRKLLGTPILVKVAAYDEARAERAIELAFAECERIENAYSRFLTGNELADLNARLGEWQEVSAELYLLIEFGQRVGEQSEGAFDLSVKSILEGWGYDANYSLQEAEAGCLGPVCVRREGPQGEAGFFVKLEAPIELGGLGKGYAIDRMANQLADFANLCINAGGDILARGHDAEDQPWNVVFEHPTDESMGIGEVKVTDLALGCSSPLRRKWRDKHHLVDPARALPAEDMLAVYTQAPAALLADAYSTALFALGYERAKALLPQLPVEAMLVAPDGRVWKSAGFEGELYKA